MATNETIIPAKVIEGVIAQCIDDERLTSWIWFDSVSDEEKRRILTDRINENKFIPYYFDPNYYLENNQDVYHSGIDPLVHFYEHGQYEDRKAFDIEYFQLIESLQYGNNKNLFIDFIESNDDLFYEANLLFDASYVHYHNPNINAFSKLWATKFFNEEKVVSYAWELIEKKFTYADKIELFQLFSKIVAEGGFSCNKEVELFVAFLDDKYCNINSLKAMLETESKKFSHFFDISMYNKIAETFFTDGLSAFLHWYDFNQNIVPNYIFDTDYYREKYTDLINVESYFLHYLYHGRYEGRLPNKLVSTYSFGQSLTLNGKCTYLNTDANKIYPICSYINGFDINTSATDLSNKLLELFSSSLSSYESLECFVNLVDFKALIQKYDAKNLIEGLERWQKDNYCDSVMPILNFDSLKESYKTKSFNNLQIFDLWYSDNCTVNLSPFFDEVYYLESYPDLQKLNKPKVLHYILHGQYENRTPNRFFNAQWLANNYELSGQSALSYMFNSNTKIKPSPGIMPILWGEFYELLHNLNINSLFDLSPSSAILEQISKVHLIEPKIKVKDRYRNYSVMPFNVDYYSSVKELDKIIPKSEILIFRDSINFGGADVVLANLYKALKINYPKYKITIVSFGPVDTQVLEKRGISDKDVVSLYTLIGNIPAEHSYNVAYDIIVGTGASHVFNVNSYALWECTAKYGKILNDNCKIFAYLFCDDRDEFGNVAGYPAEYYFDCIEHLSEVYLDSNYLFKALEFRGLILDKYARKTTVLKTPIKFDSIEALRPFDRVKSIAWAGRFDEQKRPDLLIEIAKRLPDYEFHVWGKRVLSNKIYDFESVDNITLHGLYDDISEILDFKCNLFLYTSAWDGIPTILLDVLNLNIPIVASNVGGVAETLSKYSIVDDYESVDEYVEKVKEVFDNYELTLDEMIKHRVLIENELNQKDYIKKLRGL